MTRATRITLVTAATILAGVAVYFWALRPLGFFSYLSSTASSDAEIIRRYWPHRLVQPEWISDVPSRLMNWHVAEAIVRLALVGVVWLVFIGIVGRGATFTLGWRRRGKPNQAASGNGATASRFQFEHLRRAVPEQRRWPKSWKTAMRKEWECLLGLLLYSMTAWTAPAAEVSTRVSDGLGNPVSNAVVDLYWMKSGFLRKVRRIGLVRVISDQNGIVKGSYDETCIPRGKAIEVDISRNGYKGYSTGIRSEYVLKREFSAEDIRRIATLDGKDQVDELREVLAGEVTHSDERLNELLFFQEHRFRSALRALITDEKVGTVAGGVLAFIGVPDDVRLVIEHAPPPKGKFWEDHWPYDVVCALLEPTTEQEWSFLRSCALQRYRNPWVEGGAIQTLKLIALPRSQQILEEVQKASKSGAASAEKAVQYIASAPTSLWDVDIITAGKKVAQAIQFGKWWGNKKPRFNEKGDMALVECSFIDGTCMFIYTATFHYVDGRWKLQGVRETLQGFLAKTR